MKYFIISLFSITSCFAQQNVMIDNLNSPNEPSIAINPNNTNQIVAGSNIDNIYRSADGGLTWVKSSLSSIYGVWGDPAIIADDANNFYFTHLSNPSSGQWLDRIVCQKSSDAGVTWNNGSYTGINGTKEQDKQWLAFDDVNHIIYMAWTQFDNYGSTSASDKSIIRFSKSTDYGLTWSTPIKINTVDGTCIDNSTTVEGCVPAIGPNGEVYLSWSGPNGLVFKKSLDHGVTWPTTETQIIPVHLWDFNIPGVDRCNGMPITACDVSSSAYRGTIYVNWSDQTNGVNDTDIFISKSTNGGATWSSPLRVNNDAPGKHQFLSWMTIDQTNGNIYIVFYDRRNYSGNNNTDVYLAYSTNGGATFTNTKISTTSFLPTSSVFFGDYTNISAHNGVIRPIWSRMDSGQTSIWTAILTQNQLDLKQLENPAEDTELVNYPNPVSDECYFSFKLYKESPISLTIYDLSGKEVYKVLENKLYSEGKHLVSIKSNLLQKGEYIYTVKSSYYSKSKKLVVE